MSSNESPFDDVHLSQVVTKTANMNVFRPAQASGWQARILQHEYDHIKGTLYVDRMHSKTFVHASVMPTQPVEAAMPLGPCECSHLLE